MHLNILNLIICYIPNYFHVFYSPYIKKDVYIYVGYSRLFRIACRRNDVDTIDYLMDRKKRVRSVIRNCRYDDIDLYYACLEGNLNSVKYLTKYYYLTKYLTRINEEDIPYLKGGLKGACEGGHIEIFNYVLSIMDKPHALNLSTYVFSAYKGGNKEIMKLTMHGASPNDRLHDHHVSQALHGACEGGKVDVVRSILSGEYGKCRFSISYMFSAYKGGNMDIVDLLLENRASSWDNEGLYGACEGGHMDIVKTMEKYITNDWENCMYYASKSGNVELVKFIISKMPDNHYLGTVFAGNIEMVKLLLKIFPKENIVPIDLHIDEYMNSINSV